MTRAVLMAVAAATAVGMAGGAMAVGPITSRYYAPGDYAETYGVGITFTGTPFATGQIDQINEYADPTPSAGNSDPAFPSANIYFAADYTSLINVVAAGTYSFSETSDDGGYLFVDGTLVTETPGNHLPSTASGSIFLTGGLHNFEFQMDNAGGPCCAEALVNLPTGVSYAFAAPATVPEPASWAMMIGGFGVVGATMRRRERMAVRFA